LLNIRWVLFSLGIGFSVGVTVAGCSPSKPTPYKEADFSAGRSNSTKEITAESWGQTKELFKTYSPDQNEKLTKKQIIDLLTRFSPELSEFVVKALEKSSRETYTFEEFSQFMENECVTLAWIKNGSITTALGLRKTLSEVYPKAQSNLLSALTEAVLSTVSDIEDGKVQKLLKLGVVMSQAKKLYLSGPTNELAVSMVKKNLWSLLPALSPSETSDSDREISFFLLSIDLLQKRASTTDLGTSQLRSPHQKYFTFIKSILESKQTQQIDLTELEKLDWKLNMDIAKGLYEQPADLVGQRFTDTFPKLAAQWDVKTAFFDMANKKSDVLADLFFASTSDQLVGRCDLKTDRRLSKEFISIFLFRVSSMMGKNGEQVKTEAACGKLQNLFGAGL
jgi:hypothetical protein